MKSFHHLSETNILQVCSIIDNWPLPTITWDALCREVGIHLKHRYSRQALERKSEIKARFQARRDKRTKLVPLDEAEIKIAKLKVRIAELEKIQADYDLRFLRHIERAILWDKSPQDLELPIEKEIPLLRSKS